MESILLYNILKDINYADSGSIIHDIVINIIIPNNSVIVIDMKGVDSLPAAFMNTCFGELIEKFGVDKVKHSFKFKNILKSEVQRIARYFVAYEQLLNSK